MDFPYLVDSLANCTQLKKLQFSNNNAQDSGVIELCRLWDSNSTNERIQVEQLTIYNNNVTCIGAERLAVSLYGHHSLKILNLQMNYIKNTGA